MPISKWWAHNREVGRFSGPASGLAFGYACGPRNVFKETGGPWNISKYFILKPKTGGRHLRTEEALFRGLKQRADCTYAAAIIHLFVCFVHFPNAAASRRHPFGPPLLMRLPILCNFPKQSVVPWMPIPNMERSPENEHCLPGGLKYRRTRDNLKGFRFTHEWIESPFFF